MKKITLVLALALAAAALWGHESVAQSAEEAAVRASIEHYFRGHATGQGEHFRKVFHPDAKLFAVREGKYWTLTSEEYAARAGQARRRRGLAQAYGREHRHRRQRRLRQNRPRLPAGALHRLHVDAKIDGEWRIINRAVYLNTSNTGHSFYRVLRRKSGLIDHTHLGEIVQYP